MDGNIFDTNVDLTVNFSSYMQDLLERARSRLLYQFKSSPVMDELTQVFAEEGQTLYDAMIETLSKRTLAEAEGVQLDVLGIIVGQERININGATKLWFSPDDSLQSVDKTPAWVINASLYENTVTNDIEYRKLIFAKIFKNHVQSASVPELRYFIKLLTNENVSFHTAAPLDTYLVVGYNIKPNILDLILTLWEDDKRVSNRYLIPLAATTRIVGVVFIPLDANCISEAFAPDTEYGADIGKLAIMVPLI